MKTAVIDLGSNSLRMGIYEKREGRLALVKQYRFSTRLAEGLSQDNCLQPLPMKRTVEAFCKLKEILVENKIVLFRAVATESLRRACNSEAFLIQVRQESGIVIEVISGEEETRYGLYAARCTTNAENFYMMDTGGGSCEIALWHQNRLADHVCLPFGSVVLTEQYCPDQNGVEPLASHIRSEFEKHRWMEPLGFPIVALGGSNRQLGKISVHSGDVKVDGYRLSITHAREIFQNILNTPVADRVEIAGLEPTRIDTISAGLCPIFVLADLTASPEIIICERSLREGIAAELLGIGNE